MRILRAKMTKIDNAWVSVCIVLYSNNKAVKRVYNMNGDLIDAIPIKNMSNTNTLIS
jgi:hypothetical protein